MDELFPTSSDMVELAGFVAPFLAWGIMLCVVFWVIGYVVWFIVQLVR